MRKIIYILILLVVVVSADTNNEQENLESSINTFAFQLLEHTYLERLKFGKDNFGLSPLSVWKAFALLAEGSVGDTFNELLAGLHLPKKLDDIKSIQGRLSDILKNHDKEVILNTYSAIYADNRCNIKPDFIKYAELYNTDIQMYDVVNVTTFVDIVNNFITQIFEGKITNVINPESLENSVMTLLDALYFKANWTSPFEEGYTRSSPFYDGEGRKIGVVNMMSQEAPFNYIYAEKLEARVLEMTYGDNKEYSMLFLVPDDIPLKKMLNNLASKPTSWLEKMKESAEGLEEYKVICYVPRFKISSEVNLVAPLEDAGVQRIFNDKKSELPGLSDVPLFVSKAKQKVEIEVNELGTVAAAATIIELGTRFSPPVFKADREFAFLIINRRHNIVLFAGVYDTPSLI